MNGDGGPEKDPASGLPAPPPARSERPRGRPLAVAAAVTAVITGLSWLLPASVAATGVGLGFLGATWWLVLRGDEAGIATHGLSLGGLFESAPLDPRRIAREALGALLWALSAALVIFPLFVLGYRVYWHASAPFHLRLPPHLADDIPGQLLVIALPEEAFFRGYLQSELDRAFPPRARVLGAMVGPSLLITSAVFAAGHFFTEPVASRLAVFFPSLLFGWMRAKTGGIGASLVFHAMCNLFVTFLAYGFGLAR